MLGKHPKIRLLIELGTNKLKNSLNKAKRTVDSGVGGLKSKLRELKISHAETFRSMAADIPGFSRAMQVIGNPYTLIIAGLVAVSALLVSSTGKAAEFNREFLNVRQLNLDKSTNTLNKYRELVLDTAFDVGLGAKETSKAFYDIQSGTGLFGREVGRITELVGKYSIATGAQLPDAVNQSIKAMKAFNMTADDVQAMLESNAKTVQVGITTFDELARVQTEYTGAAAGAGQTLDTANKIFAAFTSIAKDSNTAATMAKTAFEGLTQAGTIKGLKSIGISLYDNNGQIRNLSDVLREVNERFKKMTPEQIDALINKIGGPEGLRNLFVKLKTGADDFFATMDAYDASGFNLDQALKNAQGDVTILKEIVGNRLNVVLTELGQVILPSVAKALDVANTAIVKIREVFNWLGDKVPGVSSYLEIFTDMLMGAGTAILGVVAVVKIWTAVQWLLNTALVSNPIGMIIVAIGALVGAIVWVSKHTEGWATLWDALKVTFLTAIKQMVMNWKFGADSIIYGFKKIKLEITHFAQYVVGIVENLKNAWKLAWEGNFTAAKDALTADIKTEASQQLKELEAQRKQQIKDFKEATKNNAKDVADAWSKVDINWKKPESEEEEEDPLAPKMTSGMSAASGAGTGNYSGTTSTSPGTIANSAKQSKSVTIHIDTFIKGDILSQNKYLSQMTPEQLQAWLYGTYRRMLLIAE